MRIDKVVSDTLGVTRNRAQFIIDSGLVSYGEKIILKHSFEVNDTQLCSINTTDPRVRYVSRSAVKLASYLQSLDDNFVQDCICLDVGASTGGFTQVLLEFWAKQVFSVDVGTLQLDEKLRCDSRVLSFEQTDIRDFADQVSQTFEIITIDVSFISLEIILPSIQKLLSENGRVFALFKPQFQVEKKALSKSGVVRSDATIASAMQSFEETLHMYGLVVESTPKQAALKGEAGNQEWLYTLVWKKVIIK
jgi:23S rRNA (cytidine1920-2'-O)/16S rRNA (cytidine1409-2'-O)-methyltransferase